MSTNRMSDGKFPQYKGIKKPPLSCQAVQKQTKSSILFSDFQLPGRPFRPFKTKHTSADSSHQMG